VSDLGQDLPALPVEHRAGVHPDLGGNLPLEETQIEAAAKEVLAKALRLG
jgi:hypothetical protein